MVTTAFSLCDYPSACFPGALHQPLSLRLLLLFSRSVVSGSLQPHGCQASLSFTISWNLLKLMSIESVMPSNHLVLYRPLLFLSSIFPSIRVFSNESALHIRWPKYWSFSFSISASSEYTGLISLQFKGLSRVFSSTKFEAISSSALSLYCPALTSVHNYWKNHSFDCTNLC